MNKGGLLCRRAPVLVAMMALITSAAPSHARVDRFEQARSYFGTQVRVTVCHAASDLGRAESAAASVWQRFAGIHGRMNAFDPASDVSAVNAAGGQDVAVHADVHRLLSRSKEYAQVTGGAFDVTAAPLTVLWRRAGKEDALPTTEEISRARQLVGAERIELLAQSRVRVPDGMTVDLGGAAAGFAADEAASIFRASGFSDFMVDAGGEIYAAGVSCEGRPWRVGINDPAAPGYVRGLVELKDQALSTSGSYEKYVTVRGERFSHIINPVTGYPAAGAVSATVIAPDALAADVLSTALCVLGPGPGIRLIDDLGAGYAAMLMIADGNALEEVRSSGYASFEVRP